MTLDLDFPMGTIIPVSFGEVIKIGTDEDDTQMYILVTEDGKEIPAVAVEDLTVFDATANDIRLGKTAATEKGVTLGEKVIPGYLTHEGIKIIKPGEKFEIKLPDVNQYDYTSLQCLICDFNSNIENSVSTNKVVISDNVYEVKSTNSISVVSKEHESQSIDLGIVNETNKPQILRYFTCKEIY